MLPSRGFSSPPEETAWSDSNPQVVEHRPRTISLRVDDITAAMAFDAHLAGRLQPPPQPRPSLNADFAVRGFSGPADTLTWSVRAPASAEYDLALLYNGANEVLRGGVLEIAAMPSGAVISEPLRERWWAPLRPWVARHHLSHLIPLRAGENRIVLRLTTVPAAQSRLAASAPAATRGAQNQDFRVWSMELATPAARDAISRRARELHSSHQWMVDGKYGLFTHFSPLTYPFHGDRMAYTNWQWGVDLFDVQAYADAVEATGARWVILTTSHGVVFWPGPNRTIDSLLKGRTCRRDLIQELANELGKRGIRFMLYFHFGATDHLWRQAVGMNDEDSTRMAENFAALFEETSRRYGEKLWGFPYIDDGFFRAYQHDPPWEKWARAIKSGHRDALVGFSPNRGPNVSPFSDLQIGDSGASLPDPAPASMYAPDGPLAGLDPGWYIAMDGWRTRRPFQGVFHDPPRFSREEYIDYFRKMAAARTPVTINLIITQDVTRRQPFFNPECLGIMKSVRKAMWGA